MTQRCPICHKAIKPVEPGRYSPIHLPFCSARCKLLDLNAWLDADYRIHSFLATGEQDDPSVEEPIA